MKKTSIRIIILLFTASLAFSCQTKTVVPEVQVTPENALQSYLNNGDQSFKWEVQDSIQTEGARLYRLIFTSQTWRDTAWNHELTVIVPDSVKYNDALLFITGGSINDNFQPNTHQWDESLTVGMSNLAKINKAIVSIIWQVPNQPRYGGKTEDELISMTLHNFQNDSDYTWPLLFPMTKSAIRAMDAIQEFSTNTLNSEVNRFVVSGASKRGWTSWLTGAHDSRVKAIAPMVIDMLNWSVNLEYHKTTWGDYSIQIEDYVKLGIVQKSNTPEGQKVTKMVDPYSYRSSLTTPKMLFMGTNDEYWPVDAIKNYIDSIPGENYICYTPNAGHNLGDKKTALGSLSAFFGTTISGGTYPKLNYSVSEENGKTVVNVNADENRLLDAVVWSATSPDREFRDKTWSSINLGKSAVSNFTYEIAFPASGYQAFYIDLKYKAPFGGDFTQSTQMFLIGSNGLLPAGK
jgi:PhoPQ-activated pathogenicity-related protein